MEIEKTQPEKKEEHITRLKKNSLHYKFFKWLYKIEPDKEYKGLCPYFWMYVITILLLPIILLGRILLLNIGDMVKYIFNALSEANYQRKNKKWDAKQAKYQTQKKKMINEIGIAYDTYILNPIDENSILLCYLLEKYSLSYYEAIDYILVYNKEYVYNIVYANIFNMCDIYKKYISNKDNKTKEKINKIAHNIYFKITAILCAITICYGIYFLIVNNLNIFIGICKVCIAITIYIGSLLLFIKNFDNISIFIMKYIFKPIGYIISNVFKLIVKIFFLRKVVDGFVLFGKIIHTIYKNNCPRIIWIDDEEL